MRPSSSFWTDSKGFTLVEFVVILFLAGLLLVSTMGIFGALSQKLRYDNTKEEMAQIKQALITFYRDSLYLPSPLTSGPCAPYGVPYTRLNLTSEAQFDQLKGVCYRYLATNNGNPFTQIRVNGNPIGRTGAVLISPGPNGSFEGENATPGDGNFEEGAAAGTDDILVFVSESELRSATAWLTQIREDVAVLNQAALILAQNDDDGDGLVDEDPPGSGCGAGVDPPGNCDGLTQWSLVDGVTSLVRAGLVRDAAKLVDPWGHPYLWNATTHTFYSAGPNGVNDFGGGDDIVP